MDIANILAINFRNVTNYSYNEGFTFQELENILLDYNDYLLFLITLHIYMFKACQKKVKHICCISINMYGPKIGERL